MIALTPTQLTIAGVVVLVLVGGATVWWTVRAAMGWHSGRALYWLNTPRPDDTDDEDDESGDGDGTDGR